MANVVTYEFGGSDVGGLGWLGRVRRAFADYQLYRQTRDELESLSARELHDLGLSRFAIRQVAYDSVYGA